FSSVTRDVYAYAYPIVSMDLAMRQATAVPSARALVRRAPINRSAYFRSYPARDAVRVNLDAFYSLAWLDLSRGPVVLSVTDTDGRFYRLLTLFLLSVRRLLLAK